MAYCGGILLLMSFLQQSSTSSAQASAPDSLLALPISSYGASISTPAHPAAPVPAAAPLLAMPLHELKNPDQLRPREELRKCLATLAAQLADIASAGTVGGVGDAGVSSVSLGSHGVQVDVG